MDQLSSMSDNNGHLIDTFDIVSRTLAWDGGRESLIDLCDHIVIAAEEGNEIGAARIAASLLIVDYRKLPELQDAMCEFALASVLRWNSSGDAKRHLRQAETVLVDVERDTGWVMKQCGVTDPRIAALRRRVNELWQKLEWPEAPAWSLPAAGGDRLELTTVSFGQSAIPFRPRPASNGGTIDLTISPDQPATPTTPQAAFASAERPKKRARTAESTLKPATASQPAAPVKDADKVTMSAFYCMSSCFTRGGELAYNSETNDISALDKVFKPEGKVVVAFGRAEVSKVFHNPSSLRVYVTGPATQISNGIICIAFNDQQGVNWFLERITLVTGGVATLSNIDAGRLKGVFTKQSKQIREVYNRKVLGFKAAAVQSEVMVIN